MIRQGIGPVLAALLLATSLASCGGGGGGGGSGKQSSNGGGSGTATPGSPGFQLSGAFQASAGSVMDGDVNDPLAPITSNDTLATAQEIPNPATVGGYVNQPGAGMPGVSFTDGDVRDYYRTSLLAGQMLRLFIAGDGITDDLDLRLLELDGTEVAVSDGPSSSETLQAPANGDYLIEVLAFSGASNYVLTVGQSASAAGAPPEPEFVPGELIVRFRSGAPAGGARAALPAGERARQMGLAHVAGTRDEELLACRDVQQRDQAFEALGIGHLIPRDPWMRALDRDTQLRRDTRILAKALRRQADVASADLNYVRRPLAPPGDDLYPLQWHYPLINLPPAWDNVSPASGVVVAVIDTGVALGHPDLQGQLLPGYDFIQDPAISLDGDGCDPNPDDPGDGFTPGNSSFHGTHVTGTVVARTSLQPTGGTAGVAGVAWNARVMPLRVLGRGGGTDFDIMQAIRYAAGLSNGCGVLPAQTAHVINLSLGGPGQNTAFQDLIQQVRAAGITVVAAAGNFATDAPFYPAAFDGVISVSAVDAARQLAPYSNFGSTIDVAAPGGDLGQDRDGDGNPDGVLSTLVDESTGQRVFTYGFAHGTSMAAPHVTGVIALMLGVNPALTPFDVDALLASGAMTEDIGSPFLFGNGLIDAFAAVTAAFNAQGGTPPVNDPRLKLEPGSLHFGTLGTQADLLASNAGGDGRPLSILAVNVSTDDGAPWLAVSAAGVDAEGLGSYRVSVDRSQVTGDGFYTGSITFDSSENDVEVPVLMQVGSLPAGNGAGHHFVVLLDPDSFESLQALSVLPQNGVYTYRFTDVPPGEYLLVAGSDSDNDFVICDPGEACGAYPTVDQPLRLVVDADRTALDFVTGFPALVGGASPGLPERGFRRPAPRRVDVR